MDSVKIKTELPANEENDVDDSEPGSVEVKNEPDDEQLQLGFEDENCFTSETALETVLKSEIDIEATQLEALNEFEPPSEFEEAPSSENSMKPDVGTTIIKEPRKLYDVERLREFGEVPFVIKRMEPQDFTISYSKAVSSVKTILEQLRRNKVPNGIGIALRISNHTPSSCILILA